MFQLIKYPELLAAKDLISSIISAFAADNIINTRCHILNSFVLENI